MVSPSRFSLLSRFSCAQPVKLSIHRNLHTITKKQPIHHLGSRFSSSTANNQSRSSLLYGLVCGILAGGATYFTTRYIQNRSLSRQFAVGNASVDHSPFEPVFATSKVYPKFIKELKKVLGEDSVSIDADELERHGSSSWSSYHYVHNPNVVVYPTSTEQVSAIVKLCHKHRVPVIPFSGGTSLEGHFSATYGGICVDFMNMDKVLEVHDADLDCIVQPAVKWEDLNDQLQSKGLFFGPDPGPGAEIGGMVGTGCSGTNAARYGTMRENVLSITAVLADGTIVKTRRRPRKSSAGYDLTHLFIGSEGTLGLVTEITLKLHAIPPCRNVAVCQFESIHDAATTVQNIMRQGLNVAAMELLDDTQMRIINEALTSHWEEKPTLFFKFAGGYKAVQETIDIVGKLARKNHGGKFQFARNETEAESLWNARKQALWSTLAFAKEDLQVWTTDVCVPLSRLPDLITKTQKDLKDAGLLGGIVSHAGDGNFHSFLLYDKNKPEEFEKASTLVHRLVLNAIHMDGTITGEHGIGLVKRAYLNEELSPDTVALMRQLKCALDPLGILNPGHVLPQPGESVSH
ncbi:D-lactate dehydrogenase [Schizosaccharomyces japonicus yFS275]|uniref:D-lactate dehydrogenase (cytochrome) n=1 Tax=Schizosaccharomyces japonicus (strain yFS275 / FY16936) TaxID=402676 RepID=B6K538_SCHJY|nr:D-lactate dehydrogenase [Schizosaccharomyces japonicus yFS275]EEB08642.1 D-lactate dehydrogenase [Schizosaccharomyces japonicus yFS275]